MTNVQINLDQALDAALSAAEIGREILLKYYGQLERIDEKEQAGLVTEADLASEKAIKAHLAEKFQEIDFLGEEESFQATPAANSSQDKRRSRWIVDPLDGTTNYVHRFPIFCISIGLEVEGEIVAGVIDAPLLNQTFMAIKGKGAFENNNPIRVSRRTKMADSLLATGFFCPNKKALSHQVDMFSKVVPHARGVRRPGAAAYDLCMVASGVFEGFWEQNLNPWDTAAGSLLVREAGGVVTQYDGKLYHVYDKTLVATNGKIHDDLIQVIQKTV